jgi:ABC-type oligopeptide transport system substrate-binding subunit
MRKIVAFLFLSLLLIALIGCNKKEKTSKSPKEKTVKLPENFKSIHQLELEEHKKTDKDSSG